MEAAENNTPATPLDQNFLQQGTRDTRMIERAVRNRWPIPDKFREAIIKRQIRVAIDPKSTGREARAAARTIIAADKINLEEEIKSTPAIHLHQHNHEQIDYTKIPDDELDALEKKLVEFTTKYPRDSTRSTAAGDS